MNKEQQERLGQLDPEVRVARMRRLLNGIVKSNFTSTHDMLRFINLYVVHTPTVDESRIEFFEQLDQPGLVFGESTFDQIVASYDDLKSGTSQNS